SEPRALGGLHFCESLEFGSPHLNPLPSPLLCPHWRCASISPSGRDEGEAEGRRLGFIGTLVRAVEGKIFTLEHVDLATGETDRVRRARELEVDVRKLFGVLSLPRGASTVAEGFTLRFGGERSARRAVPRRIYEDQSGQEPNHERKRVRVSNRER